MSKEFKRAINIIIVAFICCTLLLSSIVSQDEHHLETCHDDDCIVCNIIKIAQTIISLSIAIIIIVAIGFLTHYFLSRLYKVEKKFVYISLVSQKVQLNE